MLQDILLVVIGLVIGAVIGFFVCKKYMEKYLKKNTQRKKYISGQVIHGKTLMNFKEKCLNI